MASAILASRNESYWGEQKVYMKKISNSNSKLCANPNPNPSPNPNSNPNHTPYPNVRGGYDTNHREQKDDASVAAGPGLSEDSSSFNWKAISRDVEFGAASASYVSFNISTLSKKDQRDLKRRLVSELEQVRSVTSRIESREFQSSARSVGYSASGIYCNNREVTSPAALQQNHLSQIVSFNEKDIKGLDAKMAHLPPLPKQELFGLAMMTSSPRAAMDSKNLLSGIMKKCSQILARLMKHKGGMWFNSPVDVHGMGLHDYRLIIKHPMDLGTVRSKLKNGFYKTPLDFAEDIRLTFNNALVYNPESHEVHKLASLLLRQFESLFGPAFAKYEKQLVSIARQMEEKQICSSWPHPVSENSMGGNVKPVLHPPVPAPSPAHQQRVNSNPLNPSSLSSPHQQQPHQQYPITARSLGAMLPKPKAKDPNKRPMSYEERQKLSIGLQSLPEEKMNQVLQIVKKRNVDTQQDGDEIVLDFETMDTETLWELDRFVYNCKKALSKIKRQEALAGNIVSSAPASSAAAQPSLPSLPADGSHKSFIADDATAMRCKKGDPVDEDIDIGEEMTSTNYPSVEIEKDDCHASSPSSSGTDSSSSSDSDSGSSSGSDSDEEDGRSPVRRSPPN